MSTFRVVFELTSGVVMAVMVFGVIPFSLLNRRFRDDKKKR